MASVQCAHDSAGSGSTLDFPTLAILGVGAVSGRGFGNIRGVGHRSTGRRK